MKKYIIASLLCLASFKPLFSQSSFTLDSILNYTLDSLQVLIDAKSLSAAIEFPDTSTWSGVSGISSLNPMVNTTTNDAFLIGSVTKTLTAACILQLAEQNVLHLDDSLHSWLDTIQYINPDITIRQLLRHQSGLYDVLTNPANQPAMLADPDSIWSAHDIVLTFINPPVFAAGAGWSYCNTNYLLLGMIIEAATGNPFYTEIRNRFLNPLALNSVVAWPFDTLNNPVAHVWLDLNGDGITDDANNFFMNSPSLNASGGAAGCYFSVPVDITKWMRRYMRGDLIDSTFMNQAKATVSAPGLPSTSYGLGLMSRSIIGYPAIGHGGDFGYAASSWYFPTKDISITVFTNDSEHNSWGLIPVVAALLKSYNQYMNSTTTVEANAMELNVYPNPFFDKIIVDARLKPSTENLLLEITDITGHVVGAYNYRKPDADFSCVLTLPEALSNGLYFLRVITDDQPLISKQLLKVNRD